MTGRVKFRVFKVMRIVVFCSFQLKMGGKERDNGVHRNGEIEGEFLRHSLQKSITRHEKQNSFLTFAFESRRRRRRSDHVHEIRVSTVLVLISSNHRFLERAYSSVDRHCSSFTRFLERLRELLPQVFTGFLLLC